jgi:hypothetical protein
VIQEEVDIPLNEFIDKLNNIYIKTHNIEAKTKNGRLSSNRINKSKTGDYGLSKYIGKVVIKPMEEQKQRIEISFRKGLPLHWQERLLKDYNLFIDNGVLNRHKIL